LKTAAPTVVVRGNDSDLAKARYVVSIDDDPPPMPSDVMLERDAVIGGGP